MNFSSLTSSADIWNPCRRVKGRIHWSCLPSHYVHICNQYDVLRESMLKREIAAPVLNLSTHAEERERGSCAQLINALLCPCNHFTISFITHLIHPSSPYWHPLLSLKVHSVECHHHLLHTLSPTPLLPANLYPYFPHLLPVFSININPVHSALSSSQQLYTAYFRLHHPFIYAMEHYSRREKVNFVSSFIVP